MKVRARKVEVDVVVSAHGSLFLMEPRTGVGREWILDNVADDATWFGGSLVVEHGYAESLVRGMQGDGLEVK
jgi:hypothetical protein